MIVSTPVTAGTIIGGIVGGITVLGLTGGSFVVLLFRRVSNSVGIAKPTQRQLEEENPGTHCPLFRHVPQLTTKLAWRSLGVTPNVPTPIHLCTIHDDLESGDDGETEENDGDNNKSNNKETTKKTKTTKNKSKAPQLLQFLVKRDDLISPTLYGGNKVRTLQHQLAICEAKRESGQSAYKQLVAIGSGGSNQVVATAVHSYALCWKNNHIIDDDKDKDDTSKKEDKNSNTNIVPNSIIAGWCDDDEPDLDNTLNMLSVLSMPNVSKFYDWGMPKRISTILDAFKQTKFVPLMLGGNCISGVLGQVSGIVEVAEQISTGDSPDVERIYLPVGSACTISGLIVGCVLVREYLTKQSPGSKIKPGVLSSPNFKIIGCMVHPGFSTLNNRFLKFHTNPLFSFMPLTITHSVKTACQTLKELGGPDLTRQCMKFIQQNVELRTDNDVVGKYGSHSELSRQAAVRYDDYGVVTDLKTGKQPQKELWICGHFVAKALQPLLHDLEQQQQQQQVEGNDDEHPLPPKYMLWMTKSAIQPRGPVDEWSKFTTTSSKTATGAVTTTTTSDVVKEWANKGQAECKKYRNGKFSTMDGTPDDYRSMMTPIELL